MISSSVIMFKSPVANVLVEPRPGSLDPAFLKTLNRPSSVLVRVHRLGELAAVGDDDLLGGLARGGADRLDGLDDVHALGDGVEDDEACRRATPSARCRGKLGSVGVGTRVGHGEDAGAGVLELEVLVGELGAVDGLAAGAAVVVGEVAALAT